MLWNLLRRRRPAQRPVAKLFLEVLEDRQLLSAWNGYGRDAQHTALSDVSSQLLQGIRWQTAVDLHPVYSGNDLLIHYGSPLVTAANTVLIPVKTGSSGGFEVEAVNGQDGSVSWTQTTDYILPPHNWVPSFSPALTAGNRLYYAGAGGTIYYIDNPDSTSQPTPTQIAFYGISNYTHQGFDGTVFINTPITADSAGNIYFGFQVTGSNPLNLVSGLARIDTSGNGTWVSAATATGDATITKVVHNCAPALSNDGTHVYVAMNDKNGTGFGRGYLVELNSTTLATVNKVNLHDPKSGNRAFLPEDGTASPTVGPDGDVYFGVLENPFPSNNDRGWLLHFSGDLTQTKTPGAFGWDDTASIVPVSMVPSYSGPSSYLLMTKYNNYGGIGTGDGQNKIAVIDPNVTEVDPITGTTVMNEVLTILGVTPDPEHPGGVREWCINNAVVDPGTGCILANSEDGKLYRWNLSSNSFTEVVTLTPGIGEAYTPTLIGQDGTVYAINNATLFAVGETPTLAISDASLAEGDSGTQNLTFTVTLTNPSGQTVTVDYATANGTALAGSDYVATSGTLTFNAGVSTQTIAVSIKGDTTDEADETFTVSLSNPVNAAISQGQATGTILNDDPHPGITIGDAQIAEGNSGTRNLVFHVNLSAVSGKTVSVNYGTADGTATAGQDYTAASGTLTFAPGIMGRTISVPILGDATIEPDQSFFVNLSSPSNGILTRSQAVGTILNDDVSVSISGPSVAEGDSGTTNAAFNLTLSAAASFPVTVDYTTANGSALAGQDFVAQSGTVTFAAGETSKSVPILVLGDTRNEPDETFLVKLSNPANAVLAQTQATGTITNDDPLPVLSINDVALAEGNTGTRSFVFTVNLSAASNQVVTVHFATADGSALAGSDYVSASGTVTFAAGQTSRTISITVNGDTSVEPDETFTVTLSSATNATLGQATGTATILNDDANPILSISDARAVEGNSGMKGFAFTVSLSSASTQTVTVQYATADGTATAGSDYVSKTGTLTFTPGQTSQTVMIQVLGDTAIEPDETFVVNLSNATNARLVNAQATGTIQNDDLSVSIADTAIQEGNSGTQDAVFTVSLSAAASFPVSVNYSTTGNTAGAGRDFVATSGTVTFAPGDTSATIHVPVVGDTLNEPDETFFVMLSGAVNARISRVRATGTIQNDDPAPTLSIADAVITEGNSGTRLLTFTVTLSQASGQSVSVNFATSDGTATTANNDYQAASGSLTFAIGQITKTITVVINGDRSVENDENFFVVLSNPIHATLARSQATGTILNDDS